MNGEQISPEVNSESRVGLRVSLIIAVIAIILVFVLYYFFFVKRQAPTESTESIKEVPVAGEPAPDLGSRIYEKAANPVAGELPNTVVPVPNPIEGIYQNPFESR